MYLFVYAYVYMYAYVRIISNQHWNINLREWCIPGYYVGVVEKGLPSGIWPPLQVLAGMSVLDPKLRLMN